MQINSVNTEVTAMIKIVFLLPLVLGRESSFLVTLLKLLLAKVPAATSFTRGFSTLLFNFCQTIPVRPKVPKRIAPKMYGPSFIPADSCNNTAPSDTKKQNINWIKRHRSK